MVEHVLITGGAGFIGSRLAARFVKDGHTVTVLDSLISQVHGDDPSTTSPLLRSLDGVAEVIEGTVTSKDDLRRALDGATIVVHLAAETGTGQSMYEIDRYVDANVGGTAKLLDILANEENAVRRVVIASSRSIYGEGAYRTEDGRTVYPSHRADADMAAGDFDVHVDGEGPLTLIPTDEQSKLHPSSVYGITKQMQESLVMTVMPTLGKEAVSVRYQNVYGPGQSLKNPYTGILSIFSTLIRQGKPINVFEDGLESRDFVYIDDIVEATFLASTVPAAAGEIFNVGAGTATTVLDVVEALQRAYGVEVPVTVSGQYRLGDIRHNIADTTKLREILDFTPKVSFDEGVEKFAEWVLTEPIEGDSYEQSLREMSERKLLK
ncbi:NAD-dependent epimerase/dehydratase family protein [Microbacterium esteraromaticum]|uniref:NAD-dependent epimerase/dehydratase family protein n=1 Tax=Microbacterium esteraromaticum TaxID=57043 RepID=A0A7D8ADL0_9MICO|nr:NAD-dependent epimerase/dehydratase family protein [Microbacterium esteraromaticum]QMU97724.1 NAD-dependent epimerase/dehydratase family protein [Microbacterium esteraromaticum]